jgi:hypothetical protein
MITRSIYYVDEEGNLIALDYVKKYIISGIIEIDNFLIFTSTN